MRWIDAPKRSGTAWELAEIQHGVLARRQLLDLGLSERTIERRLASRRLHRVWLSGQEVRSVYAVGRAGLTQRGRWMAAVLACGDRAVLSFSSAAALMGIVSHERASIEVTVHRTHSARTPGVRIHRPTWLPPEDLWAFEGIPVTSPIRTLMDLATILSRPRLEAAVNAADAENLVDPESLGRALARRTGQRGAKALRRLLDPHVFRLTRSELERWFLPIARRAGLPVPQTRVWLNGFEVDFHWPELGLVVETDGGRWHRTGIAQTRDRKREHAHVRAGLLPLRFTHWQVRHEAGQVLETLRSAASQRAP